MLATIAPPKNPSRINDGKILELPWASIAGKRFDETVLRQEQSEIELCIISTPYTIF